MPFALPPPPHGSLLGLLLPFPFAQPQRIPRLPRMARLLVVRASAALFDCLRFALAVKAVASCSALQSVMFFAGKSKNTRQSSTSTYASPRRSCPFGYRSGSTHGSRSGTLAPLAAGSRLSRAHPQTVPLALHSLQLAPSGLAAGAFSFRTRMVAGCGKD